MTGGFSSRFKPKEPSENKHGFRKVKSGEGAASVWGEVPSDINPLCIKILDGLLLAISFCLPVIVLVQVFTHFAYASNLIWAGLAIAHLFLIISEVVTRRELPARMLSMLLCWGSFALWIVLSEIF